MGRIWLAIRIFFLVLFQGSDRAAGGRSAAKTEASVTTGYRDEAATEGRAETGAWPSNRPSRRGARPSRSWPRCNARPASSISSRNRWTAIATPRSARPSATCIAIAARCSTGCSPSSPIVDQEEGSPLEVPAGFDAGRYRLTGNVVGRSAVSRPAGPSRLGGDEVPVAGLVGHAAVRPGRRPGGSGVGMRVECTSRACEGRADRQLHALRLKLRRATQTNGLS